MKQTDRNKIFDYFKREHLSLLTSRDIDVLIDLVKKPIEKQWKKKTIKMIIVNRLVYAILTLICFAVVPKDEYWIFIAGVFLFNVVSAIMLKIDSLKDGI